jgi:hypothetical protein
VSLLSLGHQISLLIEIRRGEQPANLSLSPPAQEHERRKIK